VDVQEYRKDNKMKKAGIFLFVAVFMLCLTAFSQAHYDDYGHNIKEGFKQIVKSPLTVADEVKEETANSSFKPFGVIGGFAKGLFYGAKDVVVGTFRILTFSVEDDNYFANKLKKQ